MKNFALGIILLIILVVGGCVEPEPLCSEKVSERIKVQAPFTKTNIESAIEDANLTSQLRNQLTQRSSELHTQFLNKLNAGVFDENFFCEIKDHEEKREKHQIVLGASKKEYEEFLEALVNIAHFGLLPERKEYSYNHELEHAEKIKSFQLTPIFGVEIIKEWSSTDSNGDFFPFADTEPPLINQVISREITPKQYFEMNREIANIKDPSQSDRNLIETYTQIITALEALENKK